MLSLIAEFTKQDMTIMSASKHLKLSVIGTRRYFKILIDDGIICWKKFLLTEARGLGPGLYTLLATPEVLAPYLVALNTACIVPPPRPRASQAKIKVVVPVYSVGPQRIRRDPLTEALFGPPKIRE